jgi:hypothetical protein
MDERAIVTAGAHGLSLESGRRRFPILSLGAESCLIDAPDGTGLRGYADIVDGDRLVATCLVVLAAPEGRYLRCTFKRRTTPRSGPPPVDYAAG